MNIRLNQLSKEEITKYNQNCADGLLKPDILKIKLPFLHIEDFIQLDSTNTYLKQQTQLPSPCLCYSECQTQGKGRLGREWQSPFGLNLLFSLSWQFNCSIQHLQGLSLCVGLAVAKALEEHCNIHNIKVKWPNDIVFEHQKLAGILIEINRTTVDKTQIIIGIGLNVNSKPHHIPDISQKWTSISQILDKNINRQDLLINIIQTLKHYLIEFESQGFEAFLQEWKTKDALYGKEIIIKNHNDCVKGIAKGVNRQGHLVLQDGMHTRLVDVGDATLSI